MWLVIIAVLLWIVWMPILMIIMDILNGNFLWGFLNIIALGGATYLTWKFVHEPASKVMILVVAELIGVIVTLFFRFLTPTRGGRVTVVPAFIMFIAGEL